MRLDPKLLHLPTSIILLIASCSASADYNPQSPAGWPSNLPKHVRYWPEDPPNRRRDLEEIEEHLRLGRKPVGVMKMSPDPNEKFYMEYWQFDGDLGSQQPSMQDPKSVALKERDLEDEVILSANSSGTIPFRPPFNLHTEDEEAVQDLRAKRALAGRRALAMLENRDFACPTGTQACSGIDAPYSCCGTDENCFTVPDTGLGKVGCCPKGATCGGTITNCNGPNTPCPQDMGGGCCIPNYVCAGVGCVINPTNVATVIVTQVLTITTAAPSSTKQTITIVTTTTSTNMQTTSSCGSLLQACPADLSGGCCPADRVCGGSRGCVLPPGSTETTTTMIVTDISTTVTGGGAVRPTSDSATTPAPTTTQTQTLSESCPAYFYACSARYGGGCCQTGRDCAVTNCPATSSTTIISNGLTVVVPVGAAATVNVPVGNCASGWQSCSASLGGNCCPADYACGTASCSSLINPSQTALTDKHSPNNNNGNAGGRNRGMGAVGLVLGVWMLVLIMM